MNSYLTDIIVVNFNTRKYLSDCIESIINFSGPRDKYRLWVIDNGSTDGSISLIKTSKWVTGIFNRENRGYARACNQGIRAGTGKYIFLLNSDLKVTANWLPPLIKTLEDSYLVAVVGPKLVSPQGYLVGAGVIGNNSRPLIRGWGEPAELARFNHSIECLSICGACMGIKREFLPRLGFFDEHYLHYFEETDYCYNARYHGFKIVYCPKSTVIHHVSGSCRDHQKLKHYFMQSRKYFQEKWKEFLQDGTEYRETVSGDVTGSK